MNHPAHAAMVPMAAGAGIGRVGEFYEQGNWYRGGTVQLFYLTWLYAVQNTQRPRFSPDTSDDDLVRLSKYFDLAPDMPKPNWKEKIWHLPLVEIMEEVDGPTGIFAKFLSRKPNDPKWYSGGLYHDNEDWGVPSLWMNSWYDLSVGPNMAVFNHIRANSTDAEAREHQYVIIAPSLHCRFMRPAYDLVVGERSMGNATFDYMGTIGRFFDRWLKPVNNGFERETPSVQYFSMGVNEWRSADQWPPKTAKTLTLYLDSDGSANSLYGDGRLVRKKALVDESVDRFVYDPTVPDVSELLLIKRFQRRVRKEGIPVECIAFRDPILLRGRVMQITDETIKVRLFRPRYWRISQSTWVEWRFMSYRPFRVDLNRESVELSERAKAKVEYLLRLAWIRTKYATEVRNEPGRHA